MNATFLKSNYITWTIIIMLALPGCDYQPPANSQPIGFSQLPGAPEIALIAAPLAVAPPPGVIYEVHPGSTLYGVRQALNGAIGTQILVKQSITMFVWRFQDGYAFFVASSEGVTFDRLMRMTGGKGTLLCCQDIKSLVDFLKEHGWKAIPASEISTSLRDVIFQGVASRVISILVFPVMPETIPEGVLEVRQ
jgi:hypothetical protein